MTPEQALALLSNLTAQLKLTLQEHDQVLKALKALEAVVPVKTTHEKA